MKSIILGYYLNVSGPKGELVVVRDGETLFCHQIIIAAARCVYAKRVRDYLGTGLRTWEKYTTGERSLDARVVETGAVRPGKKRRGMKLESKRQTELFIDMLLSANQNPYVVFNPVRQTNPRGGYNLLRTKNRLDSLLTQYNHMIKKDREGDFRLPEIDYSTPAAEYSADQQARMVWSLRTLRGDHAVSRPAVQAILYLLDE